MIFVSFPTMAQDGRTFKVQGANKLEMTFCVISELAKTCELQKVKGAYGIESLTIPETADGYTVTRIGNSGLSYLSNILTIVLPETITEIAKYGISSCSKLVNINIPSGVTYIGPGALAYCNSLEEIKLPVGVTAIGSSAFYGCKSLQSINLPEGITEIDESTFRECKALKHIDFPSTLKAIRSTAFYSSSLESAILPEGVQEIGKWAFGDCKGLQEITIPSTAILIHEDAFLACPLIKKATINCPNIGKWFKDKDLLEEITLGPTVRTIADNAFQNCYLHEVDLPEGLTTIGDYAFEQNGSLTKLTISSTVTKIGNQILSSCPNLETLVVKCPQIPGSAFSRLSIKNLSLDGVEVIGETAFCNCQSLEEIDWGTTLQEIGRNAFESCLRIYHANLTNVKKLGKYCFYGCSGLLSVDLPSEITEIPVSAFERCTSLQSIDIPKTVTVLGEYAFEGCSTLEKVVIPEGVTHVWDGVFENCTNLKSISFPSTMVFLGQVVCASDEKVTDVYCYMTNPSKDNGINPQFTSSVYKSATLHIPVGTSGKYSGIFPWKNFKNVVEMNGNGDVDGNGEADMDDIRMIISVLLGHDVEGFDEKEADVNGDGKVNIVDCVVIRNWIRQSK